MRLFRAWALADRYHGAVDVPIEFYVDGRPLDADLTRQVICDYDALSPAQIEVAQSAVSEHFREDEVQLLQTHVQGVIVQEIVLPCGLGSIWPVSAHDKVNVDFGSSIKDVTLPFSLRAVCHLDYSVQPRWTADFLRLSSSLSAFRSWVYWEQARRLDERAAVKQSADPVSFPVHSVGFRD